MKLNSKVLFSHIIDSVIKHPGLFVIIACILTVLAVLAITLKFEIRSDIKELMPQDAQVVQDLQSISDRMGSISTLNIYLRVPELIPLSEQAKQSDEYQNCLTLFGEDQDEHLLRDKPPVGENWCDNTLMLYSLQFVDSIRSLDSIGNIGFLNDKTFFENNLLLYASNDDLEKAYKQIDEALTEARRQSGEYKACLITADNESECDSLKPGMKKAGEKTVAEDEDVVANFKSQLRSRYEKTELANIHEFPLYSTNDGWMIAIEIRFKKATTGLKAVQHEVDRINELISPIDINQYDPRIRIEYGGGLNDMKAEYNAIVTDIVRSISVTILSILALIALFFRSIRASLRIFGPLIMSTLWALGVTFLTIGYLNLITAFIFAILIGLGIDFGIHLYARFYLERRNNHTTEEAVKISVVETGSPLFFGALTTTAAFFTLMLGNFPGFSQFGFVAGIGVLLAFMTMTTVMPAFIILLERLKPSKIPPARTHTPIVGEKARKLTIPVIAVSLIAAGIAIWCVCQIPKVQFEGNFYNLKFKPAFSNANVETKQFVQGNRPTSPTVVLLENYEQVETLELELNKNREYEDFQIMRRLINDYQPNFMTIVDNSLQEIMPWNGQYRSIPIMLAISRTLPQDMSFSSILPIGTNYGSEKSQALQLYRNWTMKMPNASDWLVNTIPEALHENTVANALPVVTQMRQALPTWLWPAMPTRRDSQQLKSFSEFASIFSFLPGTEGQQKQKLETIAKIKERTSDRQIRFLPDDEKQKIAEFRRYLVENPLYVDDLPEWCKLKFKESGEHPLPPRPESGVDYSFGNVALLYQTTSTYQSYQAAMLAREARSIRIDNKPITAATGAFVYADMIELVQTDGLHISMIALIVILLIAIVQQRHPISALIITLPVLSGLALALCVMMFMDGKLGLFNIVILPVTLGIGIDGAIYLFQRYQMLGKGSVFEAIHAVIGPVFMSSATTLVGFGGMIFSNHMGLNSMGSLAIIGISSCFVMTFLIQPGLMLIADRLNIKGAVPKYDIQPQNQDSNTPESQNQNSAA